ncbi:lipocalin family protein [Spirosoma areae]
MKRYVYALYLLVSFAGLNSCKKKSDPEPEELVVGNWSTDYVLRSGLTGAFSTVNGQKADPVLYGVNDSYEIKPDKTFSFTDRSGTFVSTYSGTWIYSGTALNLTYDNGDQTTLNYDGSATPHLTGNIIDIEDSLMNPATKQNELMKFSIQFVYSK